MSLLQVYITAVGPQTYAVYAFYPTAALVYLYICMNPFIYGLKHESSRKMLLQVHKHHLCFYVLYKDDLNLFIYGLKHEGVKQELARLFSCRKTNTVLNT